MSEPPTDPRSAAEQARDTAGILGSLRHEGYVPTPEAEAIHQRVARGEITTEEAIEIFRQRALAMEQTGGASSTMPQVKLDELLEALEYVSSVGSGGLEAAAYLCRDTGQVYFVGTDMDAYARRVREGPRDLLPIRRLRPVQGSARGAGAVIGLVRV